ncbi:glucose 1-dehydrogenase [Hymenobacter taeanensis]|uniref:Glucose 1-dehydrogenase n=1 Tax=Hymenobacter taeanensis TaxID=2735321 RepID=A0A6M6BIM6_9BACT|nr:MULTISPECIES: glucose 1-dehydrogenase [Hymenobacter]QJX47976.1 glucose 1-dehydrogenase [Hymenobacter taeanensis]UOQ82576.1 glucose 1-dehydrogenase [Hymenobacter sp. 5414T-23]
MENVQNSGRPLAGKVAIVTGASRGIGRAVAEQLGQQGAAVVVNYSQNATKAEEVVAALIAQGGRALAVQANIGNASDIRRLFEQTQQEFGRLDILVNNAGVAGEPAFGSLDEVGFAALFDVNVRGVLFAAQEAAARFGPDGGRIINLSSVLGSRPSTMSVAYGATKAAVDSITKSLAALLGPRGIRVNAVAPGLTATDMASGFPEEVRNYIAQSTALGRLGNAGDIAAVVTFLASDAGSWITGQTLYADGGNWGAA